MIARWWSVGQRRLMAERSVRTEICFLFSQDSPEGQPSRRRLLANRPRLTAKHRRLPASCWQLMAKVC